MPVSRQHVILVLKTTLALAIIVAIGLHFYKLLSASPLQDHPIRVRYEYLVPAGLLYLAAHTLWGTFFWQLLRHHGASISWLTGVRTYFVSQMGKYVPGKAWVIVMRVILLKPHGLSTPLIAVNGIYETLTSMAAGAMIGACLLPWSGLATENGSRVWYGFFGVALLPVGVVLLNRLVVRVSKRYRAPNAKPLPSPPVLLLFQGLLQASLGWCFLGASLWLTLQGLTDEPIPLTVDRYLGLIAATGISYIAGFIALILPGGLGVREEVLQRMLTFQLDSVVANAQPLSVVASLVLRLVWTLFELVFALFLWWIGRPGVKHVG